MTNKNEIVKNTIILLTALLFFFGAAEKVKAKVYDIKIEYPTANNPDIDCDIGDSVIAPANPICGLIPRTININPGDQLRFINNDSSRAHQPSSDPHPTHENYPALNLAVIGPGETVTSPPLLKSGTWGIHSHFDTSFVGVVVISAPSSGGGKVIDLTPPSISNVRIFPDVVSAMIRWQSDELSSGQIAYGLDKNYGSFSPAIADSIAQIYHEHTVTGLKPGTTYHFAVKSFDSSNNISVSEDFVFTTVGVNSAAVGESVNANVNSAEKPVVNSAVDRKAAIQQIQLKLIDLLQQLVALYAKMKLLDK